MFQATMREGFVLKKIVESVKDIVSDVNLEVDASGIEM